MAYRTVVRQFEQFDTVQLLSIESTRLLQLLEPVKTMNNVLQ